MRLDEGNLEAFLGLEKWNTQLMPGIFRKIYDFFLGVNWKESYILGFHMWDFDV